MFGCKPATLRDQAHRGAVEPGGDTLDHVHIIAAIVLLGDITEMRRDHDIVELAQRMVDRQRLLRIGVQRRARDAALLQQLQQGRLVDQRAARGVDQVAGRLHPREIIAAHKAPGAGGEHRVDGDDIRGGEQFFLGGIGDPGRIAGLPGQVGAPRLHVHTERLGDHRHLVAELAETNDAERFALDILPDGHLPGFAGFHAGVLETDLAGELEHQADGKTRGGIPDIAGAADGDAALFRRLQVEGCVTHARGQQQFQFRQRREHLTGERRALAHGADDLEILQSADGISGAGERLVEHGEVDAIADRSPVGQFQRNILIVVENCTAQRHLGSPSIVRIAIEEANREEPYGRPQSLMAQDTLRGCLVQSRRLLRRVMLGVPGRPRAAHVVVLGTVGIERCHHELAQEIDDLPDQAGLTGARCGAN